MKTIRYTVALFCATVLMDSVWLMPNVWAADAVPTGPAPISDDVPEAQGWRVETITRGLNHPWSIVWLPDGTALISERAGRLRRLVNGVLDPNPIPGLPTVLAEGQGGLLDLALHPDFETNRWLYMTLAIGTPTANRTALARGRFEDGRLHDAEILFRNADTKSGGQHFGSRILWLPDQTLLMSIGDGGNPPIDFQGNPIRDQAQSLKTHFGSVVRLRDDGTAPADNPFVDQPQARAELWTIGHRNIQGLARDPTTEKIWVNEHGARGGDELNLLEPGANYGWPLVTYSREYWGPRISNETSREGIAEPTLVWTPSIAPSGLAISTSGVYPQWQGDLFTGALRARQIRRVRLDGNRVVVEEKLTIGERVRDVRQGPDGYLYVLTDQADGALLRIIEPRHQAGQRSE